MNTYRLLLLNVAIATVAAVIDDVPWKRAKCQVSLYDDCKKSPWATIGLGEYSKSDLEAKGFKDNLLSGIKIEGDESCRVELFDDPNDEGKDRFKQVEGPKKPAGWRRKGPIRTFYKGHSKFSYRKGDGTYAWSDGNMDSIFSDGECHEYQNYGEVTSAPFKEYNDRTSSIRVAWRNAKKANDQTIWPDVGRAEFKDDFDANWGESQCICELADDEKNMCTEAFSDREPRCERYNNLVSGSCESNTIKYAQNDTQVRKSQVCGWKERCANFADNPTLSSCVKHDHKFCALRRFLGGDVNVTVEDKENPVVWYQTCEADQTCCGGQCCDAKDEVCVPMNSKSYGLYKGNNQFGNDYKKIIQAVGGSADKAVFYYDFLLYDLEAVEVNGWKMPNGDEFKNRPMMCQKKIKDWDRVILVRVFYRPFFLVGHCAGMLGWVVHDGGMKAFAKSDNLSPLLLMLSSLLLIFSPYSNLTIFLSILGAITMMWPQDKWHQWLALGQFLALWYILGGANVFLHNDEEINDQNGKTWGDSVAFRTSDLVYSTDHHTSANYVRLLCRYYYNSHFMAANNPYVNPFVEKRFENEYEEAWGLCATGWVATTLYLGQIQIFILAVMVMQSLRRFARPGDAPDVWPCCKKQGSDEPAKQKSVVKVVKPAPSSADETEEEVLKKDDDPAETDTGEEFKKDDV